jgi:hypothetical protein
MRNRVPAKREERPPLPTFDPVPRKSQRHDGWTPERQKAFIEALADTASVSRAAAMVNMAAEGAYMLRRAPGAEGFRRAWEAALDFGVARMKDIAFERAIEGQLVPMMVGGKLIGWRRIYNDRLLMFCLRHYGEDSNGKRTKIEYFSTRAAAGAVSSDGASGQASPHPNPSPSRGGALAEASTTTVRTVISGRSEGPDLDSTGAILDSFDGVELDEEAKAAILAALADCAARRREVEGSLEDPTQPFVAATQPIQKVKVYDPGYKHPREEMRAPAPAYHVAVSPDDMVEHSPHLLIQPDEQYRSSDAEFDWQMLDDEEGMRAVEEAVASVKKANAK